MDFDEHEDQEEEMEAVAVPQSYDSLGNSALTRHILEPTTGEGARRSSAMSTRYRECLKNHALSVGGHAVDGCGEFLPAGEEGTLDALKCAACNCHRNFHRKETDNQQQHHHHQHPQFSPYYRGPQPAGYLHLTPPPSHHRPLALPSASGGGAYSHEEEDVSNPSSSGGGAKKRFRTKFTAEQKEKMLEFAETTGWRIRREDDAAVERFCEEMGVTRHVLKVWIHNNKNTHGKKP